MIYGIIGGDFRNVELTKLLAKGKNIVYTYGLEKEVEKLENEKILICKDIKDLQNVDRIITAMPLTKDEIHINMPLQISKKGITIDETLPVIKNKIVFTGNASNNILEKFESYNIDVIDIMKEERFAVLNTIPTVEETIKIIIENMKRVIHNTNCLIMGYGRIGKVLAKKLDALSVNVQCLTTTEIEKVWCKVEGYKQNNFKDIQNNDIMLRQYDIIVNTIPKIILKDELKQIRKDTLIIDLASKPYGIDRKIVKDEKLNFIEALGLPGKSAPITVAENMYEIIKVI